MEESFLHERIFVYLRFLLESAKSLTQSLDITKWKQESMRWSSRSEKYCGLC